MGKIWALAIPFAALMLNDYLIDVGRFMDSLEFGPGCKAGLYLRAGFLCPHQIYLFVLPVSHLPH